MLLHPFEPVCDENSKILILGTFPSVKSRETGFYYGHAQNRFWKVLSRVLGCAEPSSIDEKKAMLIHHGIALWDVLQSCEIEGSSDSKIKNPVPNDIPGLVRRCAIGAVFANGNTAYRLYMKYVFPKIGIRAIRLPSTSPANAVFSIERLCDEWEAVAEYIYKKA